MGKDSSKLALGTVQFGLDYGISNLNGKVLQEEVGKILQLSKEYTIDTLDTAAAYGESEAVLGENLAFTSESFKIVSKLPACRAKDVKRIFANSLQTLKQRNLFGYLIHDFKSFEKDPFVFEELMQLQQKGLIQKIGFSFYYPHQLEKVLRLELPIQLIQIPFNIFDQRFANLFDDLVKKNIEIHVRSVFLQGLVFKSISELPPFFEPFKSNLLQLSQIIEQIDCSLPHVLLAFAHLHAPITKIVVGVSSVADLIENNGYLNVLKQVQPFIESLKDLASNDERFLLPFNWKFNES